MATRIIVVGKQHHTHDVGRQDDPLHAGGGERRPHWQMRANGRDGKRRLDSLGETHETIAWRGKANGAAADWTERFARRRNVGLRRPRRIEIGAVERNHLACRVARDRDHAGEAALGLARNERLVCEIATELDLVAAKSRRTGRPERRFKSFMWTTRESWSCRRRVVAKAEWTQGGANPRFVVTSLRRDECKACDRVPLERIDRR